MKGPPSTVSYQVLVKRFTVNHFLFCEFMSFVVTVHRKRLVTHSNITVTCIIAFEPCRKCFSFISQSTHRLTEATLPLQSVGDASLLQSSSTKAMHALVTLSPDVTIGGNETNRVLSLDK